MGKLLIHFMEFLIQNSFLILCAVVTKHAHTVKKKKKPIAEAGRNMEFFLMWYLEALGVSEPNYGQRIKEYTYHRSRKQGKE